ncbi:hypothetical protein [Flavobacterium sp. WC2429]|uniref:ImmA/IrrE family metallo-endopeptidase n=2 Tax=unclassified Flavobacterium TaxID=196869 RepID=A0AB39WE94_9FLAO
MEQFDNEVLSLLEELKQKHDIRFETHDENYCGVSQQNNTATVFYNPKQFNNASIAHELLHVWLSKFEYHVGSHIYLMCLSDSKLSKIMTKFLCDYIENLFDHNKMYPKYKEMGYSDEDFIVNGLEQKCSISDIKQLSLSLLNVYNANSINRFIGYLLSIYADHVFHDYLEHLSLLKNKNAELFKIVTVFWNRWLIFDVTVIDPIFNSSYEISNSFLDEMETWVANKKIK